jgi:hypothetical protein
MRAAPKGTKISHVPRDKCDYMSVSWTVRAAGDFSCLTVREAFPGRKTVSFRVMHVECNDQYLVWWEVREIA